MDDTRPMRGVERITDLRGAGQRLCQRQRPRDGEAVHELHDQVIRADVVQLADVRMVQCRDGTVVRDKASARCEGQATGLYASGLPHDCTYRHVRASGAAAGSAREFRE